MSKKEEKINDLQSEFNRIQEENKDLDVSKYLAKREDLPDLGEIQIYDYDVDIEESKKQGSEVLESLVDLYLGDTHTKPPSKEPPSVVDFPAKPKFN
jgi:hypothetical protein